MSYNPYTNTYECDKCGKLLATGEKARRLSYNKDSAFYCKDCLEEEKVKG